MNELSNSVYQQILRFINRPEIANKPLVVALSGGVDSMVLLSLVASLKSNAELTAGVTAVHVHHGLSANADQWLSFCQQQCEDFDIEFKSKAVTVKKSNRQSLEAVARDARYQAFSELTEADSVILTGHHQDDQTETFLLALKRGSGVNGLAAMSSVRDFTEQRLLARPLLNIARAEIEQFAADNNLAWVEDESNLDTSFDRNFLRQSIIPQLRERWPSIEHSVNRSASHCLQAQQLLEQYAEQDLSSALVASNIIDISKLEHLSKPQLVNTLRLFVKNNNQLMPSQVQLEQVIEQCFTVSSAMVNDSKISNNAHINIGDYSFRRHKQQLHLTENFADISEFTSHLDVQTNSIDLNQVKKIHLPDNLGVLQFLLSNNSKQVVNNQSFKIFTDDLQKIEIKFTHDNPKCLPEFRQQRRPLKKVLQELAVPSWQRQRLPLVFINGELAAVLPLFVCKPYLANTKSHEQCLLIEWQTNSERN
ncbi:tRNA lysidine(34) synthetase TilS [Thalassotalea crassostreae]|uniref:tRNA lysidine(34) synthetase TilS n=1 Tax=Thalassotalea crassostreae TaxID=1763536 RepID=UPI000838CAF6|nr:tRNA lysidine(34) synthetase TilS [Thalassotalea crassostreae]